MANEDRSVSERKNFTANDTGFVEAMRQARENKLLYVDAAAKAVRGLLDERMTSWIGMAFLGGKTSIECKILLTVDFGRAQIHAVIQHDQSDSIIGGGKVVQH